MNCSKIDCNIDRFSGTERDEAMEEALGLIEVRGWAAAIVAVDAAAKAAGVRLVGTEATKGSGQIVVKLAGDVAAVRVGIDAAAAAVQEVSKVVAAHVIPRPGSGLK